jgi:serine/threonine-protein kinase HipA
MGALEYRPTLRPAERKAVPIEVERLIGLAQLVLDERTDLLVHLKDDEKALETILRTGTSAGGARAKALIALNRRTREIRSGQVPPPPGFEPWILKFDGVVDRGLGEPIGFGRIEYAYHLMARRAGIGMAECELLEEGGRAHFMTKRFDRTETGGKLHMQSLCALAHLDFNLPGAFAYEEAFGVIQRLNLGHRALEEMFRRMVFNVVARNQDDHTKNIAFLMSREGEWSLAPAFDVMWAYNPGGPWTREHQMSINGRRDGFTLADLLAPAGMFGVKRGGEILDRVVEAVRGWEGTAKECGVLPAVASQIGATHRLSFPP